MAKKNAPKSDPTEPEPAVAAPEAELRPGDVIESPAEDVVIPPPAPAVSEAQREYEALAAECAGFDKETQRLVREADDATKALKKQREQERLALLKRKGEAHKAWQAEKDAAATT